MSDIVRREDACKKKARQNWQAFNIGNAELITVHIGFVRAGNRNAEVFRLCGAEFVENHTDLGQVQAGNFLIQVFR